MKIVRHLLTLLAFVLPVFAQTTFPSPFINAQAPPAPVAVASVNGTPGISQYLYVVVAHYPSGDVPSNVIVVNNGAATLTGTNKIVLSWAALPFVTNYDVLQVTANPFTYANCTCAIAASATTALTLSDTGAALNAYTVRTLSAAGVSYWDLQTSFQDVPRLRTNVNGTFYQGNEPRGTVIPTYCAVGDHFFKTDNTAGQNEYLCTAANTWTQVSVPGAVPSGACGGDLGNTFPNCTVIASHFTSAATPNAAAGVTVGSAALPFSSLYVGGAATNNFQVTGTATAARVVTLPDASITVPGTITTNCGTTSTCAATNISTTAKVVGGAAPLVSGTPSAVTITGISPAFTSTTSFACVVSEQTASANNLLKVVNTSTSSITITGPNSITDIVTYICTGN